MSEKTIYNIFCLIVVSFLFIVGGYNTFFDYIELKNNSNITRGVVTEKKGVGGRRIDFQYIYNVNEIKYTNKFTWPIFSSSSAKSFDLTKPYFVLYNEKDPRVSALIYEVEYDSLQLNKDEIFDHLSWWDVYRGWVVIE